MDSREIISALVKTGTKDKFIKSFESMFNNEKHLMPENEIKSMTTALDIFKNTEISNDKQDSNLLTSLEHQEFAQQLVIKVLPSNHLLDKSLSYPIAMIAVNYQHDVNLYNFPRKQAVELFQQTVFETHQLVKEYFHKMKNNFGKIIILNNHKGINDAISYTIQGLMETMYREIRNTQIKMSLIDYDGCEKTTPIVSRVQHIITSENPKFHYCVGTDVYMTKLFSKQLDEDILDELM